MLSDQAACPSTLSVVVAAQDARATVAWCLEALERQRRGGPVQVILVDNSTDGTAAYVRQRFPSVEVIERTGPALVPELWAEGILRSLGEIVALTTAQMVPDPGWAQALLQEYAGQSWAGVGGVILPAPGLSLPDQAIYWLRYGRYARGPASAAAGDIPGDNASYRRAQLLPFAEQIRREGFWENEINAVLHRRGAGLCVTAEATVRYHGGTRFARFARQRLAHGRRFGARRIAGLHGSRRALLIAAWPLTPLAFLARICRDALRVGGGGSLVRALPALLCLLMCWSVGELLGYLSGRPNGSDGCPARA